MLSTAENFAAAHVLTEWPEALSYDELLTAIETDSNPDVIIWETYENHDPRLIVEIIEGIRADFLNHVRHMTESLRAAIREGDPMTIAERLASLENQLGL